MCGGLGGFVLCHSKDIGSCKKNKAVSPFAMEAASSSILFRFHAINSSSTTTAAAAAAPSKFYYETPPRNSSYDPSRHLGCKPFFCAFPRIFNFPGKCLLSNGFTAFSSSSSSVDLNPSPELAVLLEVDGVLMDAFRSGNRQAFNVAFRKLGLDCANWTEPIYLDLVRKSAGDEERMLVLFFNRIGWPTALPTSEKGTFMKSVLREKKNALDEFMVSQSSSLRPGVEDFIDDASKDGIPMVILTAYGKSDEKIARSIVGKLGHERMSKIKIIGNEEVKQSFYGQLAFSEGLSSDLNEQLAKEARKAASAERQRIAEEVASMLKLSVELDTSSSESVEKIVAALRAGAEYAAVSVQNCILIAGSKSGVAGAEKIGMPCVVLRSSLTSRAEFPSAKAVMDGFGGADLTIAKLRNKRWSLDGFL